MTREQLWAKYHRLTREAGDLVARPLAGNQRERDSAWQKARAARAQAETADRAAGMTETP